MQNQDLMSQEALFSGGKDIKALVPIQKNDKGEQLVNARDLHQFLEIGKDFSNWIKGQIKRGSLIENKDYVKLALKGDLSYTKQTLIEYLLPIETAKYISMMSFTKKGTQARWYFVEVEKELKKIKQQNYQIPQSFSEALVLAGSLQKKIEVDQPKVQAFNHFMDGNNNKTVGAVAKALNTGQNKLFSFLREHGYLNNNNNSVKNIIPYIILFFLDSSTSSSSTTIVICESSQ